VVFRADFRRAHDKVAVFVILVKWAKASHVNTSLAQRYELTNNLLDLGSVENFVNDPLFDFRHKQNGKNLALIPTKPEYPPQSPNIYYINILGVEGFGVLQGM
jgi:hypothetical protein